MYNKQTNHARIGATEWFWLQSEPDDDSFETDLEPDEITLEDLLNPDLPLITDTLTDFAGWLDDEAWMDTMQDEVIVNDEVLAYLREEPILSLTDPFLSPDEVLNLEDYLLDEDAFFADLEAHGQQLLDPETEVLIQQLATLNFEASDPSQEDFWTRWRIDEGDPL